ncbi:MAG: MFS transporter [Acidimicrobiales bacterium]
MASAHVGVIVGAAVVVMVATPAYAFRARRIADPVVRVNHLLDSRYRRVHVTSMAVLAGGVGANSFLPLYLRTVRGQSSSAAAFAVLFLTVGWSTSAWVSSRLQDRWPGEVVTLLGSGIALPGVAFSALVVHVDAAIPVVYGAFFWLGAGVGMITSTGAALLQSRTADSEMGRLNAAHQFLRTLSITFGIAVVGAITLAVVGARTGDVEVVRDALAGDDVTAPPAVLRAIGDGYALSIALMTAVVAGAVVSAVRLVQTRDHPVVSAR